MGLSYTHFWEIHLGLDWLKLSIEQWVNDALMAVFFFLVGIEIKRELLVGQLSNLQQSLLPLGAALGGIIVPALIYIGFNIGTETAQGWAIPSATDIAFSLAVLSILGKSVPLPLKVFLMALAVIDDLGAILIIAFFYTGSLHIAYLFSAALLYGLLVILNRRAVPFLAAYVIVGVCLWFCILRSGIHATVAGVLLASVIPLKRIAGLEHLLHKPVNYGILPVFALANTAIVLSADVLAHFIQPISLGIFFGLLIGKPMGVLFICFCLIQSKIVRLPAGVTWPQLIGVSCLAGIGFTIAIFVTTLSFDKPALLNVAKLAIISASLLAGVIGYSVLRLTISAN